MLRHQVKPGITGWAQVNGLRGETATLDKMRARIRCDIDIMRNKWLIGPARLKHELRPIHRARLLHLVFLARPLKQPPVPVKTFQRFRFKPATRA
jgi:Bacterial sugar transferase